jgi:putative cardiolipin synthase
VLQNAVRARRNGRSFIGKRCRDARLSNPVARQIMNRMSRRSAITLAAVLASLTTGCASLPSLEGRSETSAITGTDGTRLGRALAPRAAANPGKTGIYPLTEGRDAFVARVLLANAADKSLDIQYYIWHGDQTGYLLFEAVWSAAERGVRVRLLLDDNGTSGLDDTIAALDAHANIEVRLYNPFAVRSARGVNFLWDFARLNRRMHNKSFTADNQATIVGGRNVGNEYFAAGGGVWFRDVDVLAVGAAVRDVSQAFDLYWSSASAYPATMVVGPEADDLAARFAATRADPVSAAYIEALRATPLARQLLDGQVDFEWATAQLLRDDPAKTLDTTGRTDVLLLASLLEVIGRPEQSFDLVSPYFVPGDEGTKALVALARRGVRFRLLTNSFAATDVSAVHSGYAKRREDLLAAGAVLYELKPSAAERAADKERSSAGSSGASLHAKTFTLDGRRLFVGSFNFDERSAKLNTEMGLLIDSPRLAARHARTFDTEVPAGAYEVRLDADGNLVWIERTPSGETRHATEPGTGFLRRAFIGFLSLLPIDWML